MGPHVDNGVVALRSTECGENANQSLSTSPFLSMLTHHASVCSLNHSDMLDPILNSVSARDRPSLSTAVDPKGH